MSNFNILDIFSNKIELSENILWQYDNAPHLNSLITSKENWYNTNTSQFWQNIISDFLNIKMATDWGLELWGKILDAPRTLTINDETVTLSTTLYRRYILGKLNLIRSNGTIPEILEYCNFIFQDYTTADRDAVVVKDNHDMTITYTFNFDPTTEELALIYSREFLPTPASVGENLIIIPPNSVFGFYGTELLPFNQAPFWDGRYIK